MQQHSLRLYEKDHEAKLVSKIVKIVERPIKVHDGGKSSILSTLGIVLAETIFHPQGGGQPADQGTINGVPVLAVDLDNTQSSETSPTIYHYLDPRHLRNKRFYMSQQVTSNLDENFRAGCQRSHTAGHLIADILELNPLFTALQAKAVKGHHFPGSEYIKIVANDISVNVENIIQQINTCLNEQIAAELPVAVDYQPGGARHIKIANSTRSCGGTHVKTTRAINYCWVTKINTSNLENGKAEWNIFYTCTN